MKKYIRTKDNKFYDTTKERYLIDGERLVLAHEYETHPTMTNGNVVLSVYITEKHVDYINCGVIDKEADDVFGLLKDNDLMKFHWVATGTEDNYCDYIAEQLKGLVCTNAVEYISYRQDTASDLTLITDYIEQVYVKQGDDYKLAWDKNRGVI